MKHGDAKSLTRSGERDELRAALRHEADCVEAAKAEIAALRAKIEAMEKQEPVGTTHAMPGASAFTVACFNASDVPVGTKLYALPGARSQPAPSVRDGWKLVPIEPTEDMLRAMTDPFVAINGDNRKAFESAYTAMLAAAPKPEGE